MSISPHRFNRAWTYVFAALVVGASSGCGHTLPPSPSPSPTPAPKAAPVVTGILPSVGSAAGGATIQVVGTGFLPGMTATFGGITVTGRFDTRDTSFTTFLSEAPVHAVGAVDLTVTNPDGQSYRAAAGFVYSPPESFDPNGAWGGYSLNGTDTWVEFVIEANRLVSGSCTYNSQVPFTFAELPSVHGGEFAATGEGGATISGRIVSASEIVGTISLPLCTTTPLPFRANRKN
jgi:hypothetical protein